MGMAVVIINRYLVPASLEILLASLMFAGSLQTDNPMTEYVSLDQMITPKIILTNKNKLDVIGYGWDNLRNRVTRPVFLNAANSNQDHTDITRKTNSEPSGKVTIPETIQVKPHVTVQAEDDLTRSSTTEAMPMVLNQTDKLTPETETTTVKPQVPVDVQKENGNETEMINETVTGAGGPNLTVHDIPEPNNSTTTLVTGNGTEDTLSKPMNDSHPQEPIGTTTNDPTFGYDTMTQTVYYEPPLNDFHSQLFTHWSQYEGLATGSINRDNLQFAGVCGSFALDYQENKIHRIRDRTVLARYRLRYTTRSVSLRDHIGSPGGFQEVQPSLNPDISNRITQMFATAGESKSNTLRYQAEKLVRDYGTHYIDQMDIGVQVVKEDNLSAAKLFAHNASNAELVQTLEAGSTIFFSTISQNGSSIENDTLTRRYKDILTSSTILTAHHPENPNLNLVSGMDRNINITEIEDVLSYHGYTLDSLVTISRYPNQIATTVLRVKLAIQEAIFAYYSANVYPGCTQLDSPNFDLWANVDDGSCLSTQQNYSFGGMYQSCKFIIGTAGNPCDTLVVNNPTTGNLSCPINHHATLLYEGTAVTSQTQKTCHTSCSGFWIFKKCSDVCSSWDVHSMASYSVYSCSSISNGNGTAASGNSLLFGGAFSNTTINPVTRNHSCPDIFLTLTFHGSLNICYSKDTAGAREHAVFLSGFSGCDNRSDIPQSSNSCPAGYSKKSISVEKDCQVAYCFRWIHDNQNFTFPALISPPFSFGYEITDNENETTTNQIPIMDNDFKMNQWTGLSIGVITGISIACVLFIITLIICAVFVTQKRKKCDIKQYEDIS